MIPNHGPQPQTSAAPYQITFCPTWYNSSTPVSVTITANSNHDFDGFMVQALQNVSNITKYGTFTATSYTRSICLNKVMVHNSGNGKKRLTFTWNPPTTAAGNLVFVGTFVESKNTFWTNVTSAVLTDKNGMNNTEVVNCTKTDDIANSGRICFSSLFIVFMGFFSFTFLINY
ncbi:DOMON domain-containing protein frrs1L [Bulinus truncatus]|nr:DOMON domain-containing protein frrs1L [Bulinus truncatus]